MCYLKAGNRGTKKWHGLTSMCNAIGRRASYHLRSELSLTHNTSLWLSPFPAIFFQSSANQPPQHLRMPLRPPYINLPPHTVLSHRNLPNTNHTLGPCSQCMGSDWQQLSRVSKRTSVLLHLKILGIEPGSPCMQNRGSTSELHSFPRSDRHCRVKLRELGDQLNESVDPACGSN